MVEKESPYKKYLREERLPHIFCPGCGNGTVMSTFFRGLEGTDIDFENVIDIRRRFYDENDNYEIDMIQIDFDVSGKMSSYTIKNLDEYDAPPAIQGFPRIA